MTFPEQVERYLSTERPSDRRVGAIGVVVTPWLNTAVPLYSVEIGRELLRCRRSVVFIADTTSLPHCQHSDDSARAFEQLVDSLVSDGARVLRIETTKAAESAEAGFDTLAFENAVWASRGEAEAQKFLDTNPQLAGLLAAHARSVRSLLAAEGFEWILIPGGVFGVSAIYTREAEAGGSDFTTYDSGPGCFFFAHRGVASHCADIPAAQRLLATQSARREDIAQHVETVAKQHLEKRWAGADRDGYQAVSRGGFDRDFDLLICLNYRADTAALMRSRCFRTVGDWLSSTVRWAEARGLRVAVREHPVLRGGLVHSADSAAKFLSDRFPDTRGLTCFGPSSPVSTYDLVAASKVVLPFTSTIGIEAVLMGKPTVLCAQTYYGDAGVGVACQVPEEYFAKIEASLSGALNPDKNQRVLAIECYYLTVACRPVYSDFTPQPTDFPKWVELPREELWSRSEMRDLRTALLTREPLAWVRHRDQTTFAEK